MKLRQILSAACLCAVSVMSAQSTEDRLSYALSQSGSNRTNLESVLSHYRNDSLKYKAACFLIENMSGYYSLKSPDVKEYYDYLHSVFSAEPEQVNEVYKDAYVRAIQGIGLRPHVPGRHRLRGPGPRRRILSERRSRQGGQSAHQLPQQLVYPPVRGADGHVRASRL